MSVVSGPLTVFYNKKKIEPPRREEREGLLFESGTPADRALAGVTIRTKTLVQLTQLSHPTQLTQLNQLNQPKLFDPIVHNSAVPDQNKPSGVVHHHFIVG
jgi:hypothetical protein